MRVRAWLGADSCSLGPARGLSPAPGGQVATWLTKLLTISTNWHSCGQSPMRGQGLIELGGWTSEPGSKSRGQVTLPPPLPCCHVRAQDSTLIFWQLWCSPGPPAATDLNYPGFSSAVNASTWLFSYTSSRNLPHPSRPPPPPHRVTGFLGNRNRSLSSLPSPTFHFFHLATFPH